MKRWMLLAVLVSGCSAVRPDAGVEAVLVRKPMFFGHGGTDETPVLPGLKWVAWTTQAIYVDMRPYRVDSDFADLMTSDGVPIDFHAVLTFQVTNSVELVKKFGNDYNTTVNPPVPMWYVRNIDQPFRTAVRDAVKRHGMNEMAIQATAAEEVDLAVTAAMAGILKETGMPVRLLDLSLGRANPPDAILHQRVETAAQEQRINTEKQRKLAEDMRKAAEESRAAADAAYNFKMNLTPQQYLELETIKMWRDVCAGAKCTVLAGGGIMPTMTVR